MLKLHTRFWPLYSCGRVRYTATVTNAAPSHSNTTTSSSKSEEVAHVTSAHDIHFDGFHREYLKNHVQLTPFQRVFLGIGSSIAAVVDPRRHDMIAALGETTGEHALRQMLYSMETSSEGQRVLKEQPRINTKTVDLQRLSQLPEDTFGFAYAKFLQDNNVTPDSRMEVRFVDDADLAYVMTRYRECHDLVHTVLGMPTNMLGEVAVKWIEALNTGLLMCYGGAVFGAFRLRPKQRKEYMRRYLPWAIQNGKNMKPLMPVFWEERWEQNINELRKELGITPLK